MDNHVISIAARYQDISIFNERTPRFDKLKNPQMYHLARAGRLFDDGKIDQLFIDLADGSTWSLYNNRDFNGYNCVHTLADGMRTYYSEYGKHLIYRLTGRMV